MQTATIDRAPSDYAQARRAELLPLVEAWKAAEDAYSAYTTPAAALAERNILDALNNAHRAGLVLLIDDLTSALSHVDGCMAASRAERERLSNAREAAREAMSKAGYGCYSINDLELLALWTTPGRPDLEVFLHGRIDYLAGMGE